MTGGQEMSRTQTDAATRAAEAIMGASLAALETDHTLTVQGMATIITQEYAPIMEAARGLREALRGAMHHGCPVTNADGEPVPYQWNPEEGMLALSAAKEAGI